MNYPKKVYVLAQFDEEDKTYLADPDPAVIMEDSGPVQLAVYEFKEMVTVEKLISIKSARG